MWYINVWTVDNRNRIPVSAVNLKSRDSLYEIRCVFPKNCFFCFYQLISCLHEMNFYYFFIYVILWINLDLSETISCSTCFICTFSSNVTASNFLRCTKQLSTSYIALEALRYTGILVDFCRFVSLSAHHNTLTTQHTHLHLYPCKSPCPNTSFTLSNKL